MNGSVSLNGTWSLSFTEDAPDYFTALPLQAQLTLPAAVPAPVHRVLIDAGLLDDPNLGLNSLRARWVEEQFWTYRRTFAADPQALTAPAWLVFERLEYDAAVYLNGEIVGRHANAHRPARFDVTGRLRAGENLLVVQLETGLHSAQDKPVGDYGMDALARATRRPWLRKPQYQCGWDWNPRLMNVGILGDVRLEWNDMPRLDEVTVFAVPNADLSRAAVTVRITTDSHAADAIAGTLRARIAETGTEVEAQITIAPGAGRHEVQFDIESPRLWWPRGHGEQALYTIEVTLDAAGATQTATRRTGIRRVEIDQSPHPVEGRYCIVTVNGRPIFCKGGNWVPADMLYSEVTPERTRELVDLAVGANFNLLRVWGGGLFADHALCDACDEAGVLLWHDFLFACAKYPGDHPEFAAEARREVTWAVRDLAHHPSMAVWCGNNEIEWGDWEWGYDNHYRTHPHYALFHHDIPKIVLNEDPSTPHWISSPWSPDYRHPNDPTVGDQHPWDVSIMHPNGADFWHYRGLVDRFPNEGGVLGASTPATLKQFLPENERRLLSPSWVHHDNPIGARSGERGGEGRAYQTVRLWTGLDPFALSMDEYAYISGLLHAEGLSEYIGNYRRRMFSSASAIFWMYNDSWPVTHGWTIVDYYRRKKLAYHPVRRAFQPVTVVVATEDDSVVVYGINEAPALWSGHLRYGLFALAGGFPVYATAEVHLLANASTPLAKMPRAEWERAGLAETGAFAVLSDDAGVVAQHRLFDARFGDLALAEPHIEIKCEAGRATFTSPEFAWGVCLDPDGEQDLPDDLFDLLPGIPYTIPWPGGGSEPRVQRIGNFVHGLKR